MKGISQQSGSAVDVVVLGCSEQDQEDKDSLLKSSVKRQEESDKNAKINVRQPRTCMKCITVEPAVIGSMFVITLYSIISNEYFYRRIASDYNFTRNDTTESSCKNSAYNESGPDYELHRKISAETASISLYLSIATFVPELLTSVLYGSWGDRVGRKAPINMSLFGLTLLFACYIVVIIFNLPLRFLLIGHITSGLFGDFSTLLGCSFSYLADVTTPQQRTLRIAVLETGIGIGGFLASITSGLWNLKTGFQTPYWFMFGLAVFNLLYSVCFLPPKNDGKERASLSNLFSKEPFLHMYQVMRPRPNNRHITLILYAICFCILVATVSGLRGILVIYTIGVPFCWDSLLIGLLSGLGQISFFVSLIILKLFPAFSLQPKLVMMAVITSIFSSILFAFSKTTWMIFLAQFLQIFFNLPSPIIRSQSSRVVSPGEVGSVFAVLSCAMAIGETVGAMAFQGIFAMTVTSVLPGAAFLVSAGLLLLMIPLYGIGFRESGLTEVDLKQYDTLSDETTVTQE